MSKFEEIIDGTDRAAATQANWIHWKNHLENLIEQFVSSKIM